VAQAIAAGAGAWFAVRTLSRHEKKVAAQLSENGIRYFLPMATGKHKWSDREKMVLAPLFPGYVFVRIVPTAEARVAVLRNSGVASFVMQAGAPAAIPAEQIEGVRMLVEARKPCAQHEYIAAGQRVRVRGGSMSGIEGVLVASNKGRTLVLSIEAIGKSVAIEVCGYELEEVGTIA